MYDKNSSATVSRTPSLPVSASARIYQTRANGGAVTIVGAEDDSGTAGSYSSSSLRVATTVAVGEYTGTLTATAAASGTAPSIQAQRNAHTEAIDTSASGVVAPVPSPASYTFNA